MKVLLTVLKFLELKGLIRVFQDKSSIGLGDRWRQSVEEALHEASLAVCLLSPQYFASEFVVEHEVPLIQKRQKQGLLKVLPVLLKDSLLEIDPWWSELQILTDEDGKPLINGNGADEYQVQQHFVKLARQIFRLLHELPEPPEPPQPPRPSPAGNGQSPKNASKATGSRRGSSGRPKGTKNLILPTAYQPNEEQFVSELLDYLRFNEKNSQIVKRDGPQVVLLGSGYGRTGLDGHHKTISRLDRGGDTELEYESFTLHLEYIGEWISILISLVGNRRRGEQQRLGERTHLGDHDVEVLGRYCDLRPGEAGRQHAAQRLCLLGGGKAVPRRLLRMGNVNNDGYLDIVVDTTYHQWRHRRPVFQAGFIPGTEPDYLFVDNGNITFTDTSQSSGIRNLLGANVPAGRNVTWGLALVDIDQDGDLDLMEVEDAGLGNDQRSYIRLQKNDGTGHFTDETFNLDLNVAGGFMGYVFTHVNRDGTIDFYQDADSSAPLDITERKGRATSFGFGSDLYDSLVKVFPDYPKRKLHNKLEDVRLVVLSACSSGLTTRETINKPEVLTGPGRWIENLCHNKGIIAQSQRSFELEIVPECVIWGNQVDASGWIRPDGTPQLDGTPQEF